LGAIDWLKKRDDIDAGKIGVYGASMGAVTAIYAAAEMPTLACAVADSAYAIYDAQVEFELEREGSRMKFSPRWRKIVSRMFLMFEPLIIGKWASMPDPVEKIRDIKCPLFLIHGDSDGRIKPENLDMLAEAASDAGIPLRTWKVENDGHCTYLGSEEYYRRVITFFREYL